MMNTQVQELYTLLGFELTDIEDELEALFMETDGDGQYVLLTNEEGMLPANLEEPVVLALYSPTGAYQWSATFKTSRVFQTLWTSYEKIEEKLPAILAYRSTNEI